MNRDSVAISRVNALLDAKTPESVLQLKNLLTKSLLQPNIALLQAIKLAKSRNDLLNIGICLRYGANPNMYIESSGISKHVHIIPYVYRTLLANKTGMDVIDNVIALFILSGADLTRPVFDPNLGGIRSEQEIMSEERRQTVYQWMDNDGYNLIQIYRGGRYKTYFKMEQFRAFNILLDNVEGPPVQKDLAINAMILKALGDRLYPYLTLSDHGVLWSNTLLMEAVKYLNVPAFTYIVKAGYLPKYPDINLILVKARGYRSSGDNDSYQAVLQMIKVIVENGAELDMEQREMVLSISKELYDELVKVYKVPYWKKVCSNPHQTEIPLRLRQLALTLNIPTNDFKSVCSNIQAISQSDREEIKEAAMKRQSTQMGLKMGYLTEFVAGSPPVLLCENQGLINGRPNDYSDVEMSYYRDSKGRVWCFTSDKYDNILETRKNIHTNEALPEEFLDEVRFKSSILHKLGMNTLAAPQHMSQHIDQVWTDDTFDNTQVDLIRVIDDTGLPRERVTKLTNVQIQRYFDQLDINTNVKDLTSKHAILTLAWVLDWLKSKNSNLYQTLIDRLKTI